MSRFENERNILAKLVVDPGIQPCPFCGATTLLRSQESDDSQSAMSCWKCGSTGPIVDGSEYENIREAVEKWNSRIK